MRHLSLLIVPFGFIVAAACSGGDRNAGETTESDAGGSSSGGGDASADADAERPCGYPGEDCCPAPAAACGTGTFCASGNGKCMLSELAVVGEYFDQAQQSHRSAIAFYDGNAWTAGPDLVVDSNWWSPTDLVSSAPGNYLVTLERHGVEGSRDEGRLFDFHAGLWHKCEPGEACVGPEVPAPPLSSVASIANEVWIGVSGGLYRCVPGGSCASQNNGRYKVVGTGLDDIWSLTENGVVHFDGTKWTVHDGIAAGRIFELRKDDVWVMGATSGKGPWLRHWDGKSWSTEYVVDGAPAWAILQSMSGSSSTDIWAVGSNGFAAHWDGATWSAQQLPAATANSSSLFTVYAPSPIEAYVATGGAGVYRWDGAQWTKMTMPTVGAGLSAWWGFVTGPAKPRP